MSEIVVSEQVVLDTLRQVMDPELGCNIVDLGLIYGVAIECPKITVNMTLTTPGCPMHESIAAGVKQALLNIESVKEVDVQLVWDPPWNPDRMTLEGRKQLGI